MYERFISSSMLTGTLLAAMSVMRSSCRDSGLGTRHSEFPSSLVQNVRMSQNALRVAEPRVPPVSDIEVLHVQRVVFNELPARLDLVAHQRREHLIGFRV